MKPLRALSRALLICVPVFWFATVTHAQEWHEINRLGTGDAICKGGVSSAEDLQAYVAANRGEFEQVLRDAGYAGDPQTVLDAIAAGNITETSVFSGTEFIWMGRRLKGVATATPNVRYTGKKTHKAYLVSVTDGGTNYQFAIPQVCCNLALLSAITLPPPKPMAAAAPAPVMAPPPVIPARAWRPYVGVFAGNAQCQDDIMLGVEAGVLKPVSPKLSLLARGGFAANGSINQKDEALFLDVGVEHALGEKAFIGAGVGIWEINESDRDKDSNFFVYLGTDTPLKLGGSTVQWFVEGRERVYRTGLRAMWK